MENRYYDEILNVYLVRPDKYKEKKVCLEYSDGDFYDSMGEDYQSHIQLLLWEKKPTNTMFKEVKFLNIDPERLCLFPEDIPDFIDKFECLETLKLPVNFGLQLKSLPQTVKHLIFINDRGQIYKLGDTKKEIKNNLLLGDVTFPSVTGLTIITLSSADMVVDGFMDINETKFPNLEFLRCIVNAKDKYNPISSFSNLKHLWVTVGKGAKLFESTPKSLISLHIDGANDNLDFSKLKDLENLEILKIDSCYSPVDCNLLASLPKLKEVILWNSKFIQNVESLLNFPLLKSIEISDCKKISAESKELLIQHKDKFERLVIL